MSRKLTGADAAWYHLEEPRNPMVVNALVELGGQLPEAAAQALAMRLLAYPQFLSRVVEPAVPVGPPSWQAVGDLDIDAHVERLRLEDGGDEELRAVVGREVGRPLDPTRPLWRLVLIDRPGRGSVVLFRVHHAVADGYALLHLLGAVSARAARGPAANPGAHPHGWRGAARALRRIVTLPRDPSTPLRRELSGEKRVAWSAPIPLSTLRRIGRANSATVNDVLVAATAGALGRWLVQRGETTTEIHAIVPVNLRDAAPDAALGNQFGLVFLELPLGIADSSARIAAVARRTRLLRGPEAAVTHGILTVAGHVPRVVEHAVAHFFAAKTSLVLTNVPGPSESCRIAGVPIARMTFWVPETASVGLGISMLSYAGNVTLGALSDAAVVPDPAALLADVVAELSRFEHTPRVEAFPLQPGR